MTETDIQNLGLSALDPNLPVPLYHQLYKVLRDKIQSGELPIGSKVPGEADLVKTMDISRITAKRALNELANTGLVTRKRGHGTIVTASTDLKFKGGVNDYISNVTQLRDKTTAEILSRKTVSAPEGVASNLQLQPGTLVEKITHRLSLDDDVLSYVITYVPHGLSQSFSNTDLSKAPLMNLLTDSGVIIRRAEQKIFAVSADQQDAEILGTSENQALLKIHCIMFDKDDRAVEDIYAWYHPEHYQYQMTLTNLDGSETRLDKTEIDSSQS